MAPPLRVTLDQAAKAELDRRYQTTHDATTRTRYQMVLLRGLLEELGEQLVLVYTPTYDPDANRIEWLWRSLRRAVTHTHRRQTLVELVADADHWARTITPAQVLSQIGSPFPLDQQPPVGEELNHAA